MLTVCLASLEELAISYAHSLSRMSSQGLVVESILKVCRILTGAQLVSRRPAALESRRSQPAAGLADVATEGLGAGKT